MISFSNFQSDFQFTLSIVLIQDLCNIQKSMISNKCHKFDNKANVNIWSTITRKKQKGRRGEGA